MIDNFSIQDWRMKLLTEVENEMPIGNRELPMGEMKTKDVANPNKGKWRVVNADTNKPFDASKFYDTKEEAQAAVEKLGRTKGSGVKIVQLKDTMKVYTKESVGNPTPEQMDILRAIQDMVMAGDTSILDMIKDKMQAEWGDGLDEMIPTSTSTTSVQDMNMMHNGRPGIKSLREAPDWVVGHSYQDGIAKKVVKVGADKVRVTFDTGDTITYQIARDNPENWVQIS